MASFQLPQLHDECEPTVVTYTINFAIANQYHLKQLTNRIYNSVQIPYHIAIKILRTKVFVVC